MEAVRHLADDGKYLNRPIELELYKSSNFLGFFVKEDDANCLKRIALKFVKEVSDSSKYQQINLRLEHYEVTESNLHPYL